MHIVLGFLGSVVTILILLNRLAEAGIDLGGLNPFLWYRRRKWQQKYQGSPVYQLTSPMEVTALLMATVAKIEGDISGEQKRTIVELFEEEFHLTRKDASALLIASTHILGDGERVRNHVEKVLAPSREEFTPEQAASAVALLEQVAAIDAEVDASQRALIGEVRAVLRVEDAPKGKWR